MDLTLKLNVNQVSAAILLLEQEEKQVLKQRLSALLNLTPEAVEDLGWLKLAESAFSFWDDPVEDLYNDLIPQVESGN
ncbi:MAG: hypothetical protein KKC71_01735 [Chloroflexi bacterium]|nr:hypothetical protein [Chloroflexota bacterium]